MIERSRADHGGFIASACREAVGDFRAARRARVKLVPIGEIAAGRQDRQNVECAR